jgi:hypothetical protein
MFDRNMLRNIRNNINIKKLAYTLGVEMYPKYRQLMFVCPSCGFRKATFHPRANIGTCWKCNQRFNPIDLTMAVMSCSFVGAIRYLIQGWGGEPVN